MPFYSTSWAGLDWQPSIDWGMVDEADPAGLADRLHFLGVLDI